jgi:hypothetical protein
MRRWRSRLARAFCLPALCVACRSTIKTQGSGAGGLSIDVAGPSGGGASGGSVSPSAGTAASGGAGSGGTPHPGGGGSAAAPANSGGMVTAGGGGATASIGGAGGAAGSGGTSDPGGAAGTGGAPIESYADPGTSPWSLVPSDQVLAVCKLDPTKLAAAATGFNFPFAIVRYGKLCYEHNALNYAPKEAYSTTKTLGAFVAGVVAYQTKDIAPGAKMAGPFNADDRVDQWLTTFSYNKDAHVAHVMAMVATNADLSLGKKTMTYDLVGTNQINSMSDILNAVIAQDKTRLGSDLEAFTKKFVYAPLGMTKSTWSSGAATKTFAYTWSTDILDMLRLGVAILHRGHYGGQVLASEDWVYGMTHPAFEDANTGYGYLTWLNSSSNYTFGGIPTSAPAAQNGKIQGAYSPGPCAPVAVFKTHPHGLSDSPDCNYSPPYTCDQIFDDGVWQAEGLGGQVIQGHPGLDLLLVVRDQGGYGPDTPKPLWDALRPAVVAADPKYKGDDNAFCADYGTNKYAPDLE